MSTRLAVGLCVSVLSLSALARDALPRDVAKFVEQHEACDQAAASHTMPKFCKSAGEHLAQLKKQYAGDPAVMRRLAEYEPGQQRTQVASSAHPQSAEPADQVMIDPDP